MLNKLFVVYLLASMLAVLFFLGEAAAQTSPPRVPGTGEATTENQAGVFEALGWVVVPTAGVQEVFDTIPATVYTAAQIAYIKAKARYATVRNCSPADTTICHVVGDAPLGNALDCDDVNKAAGVLEKDEWRRYLLRRWADGSRTPIYFDVKAAHSTPVLCVDLHW